MENIDGDATLQGTCPSDAQWWTCKDQTPSFLGCCVSDPCNGVGCPTEDLRAAGLGRGAGPDACEDDSSYWPYVSCPSGGLWYTCLSPSFQGCCTSNPCTSGECPSSDLRPASFNDSPMGLAPAPSCPGQAYYTPTNTPNTMSSMSLVSTPTMTRAVSSASAVVTTTNNEGNAMTTTLVSVVSVGGATSPSASVSQSHGTGPPVGAIAGGAAGGVGLIIMAVIAFCCYRRHRRSKAIDGSSANYVQPESQMATEHVFPLKTEYYNDKDASPNVGTPAPPYYAAYQDEVHEISTSNSQYPAEAGDGQGLGINSYSNTAGVVSPTTLHSVNHNRISELSGITAMNSPTIGYEVSPPMTPPAQSLQHGMSNLNENYTAWQGYRA